MVAVPILKNNRADIAGVHIENVPEPMNLKPVAVLALAALLLFDTSPRRAAAFLRESALAATQAWSDATDGNVKFSEGPGGVLITWDASGTLLSDPIFL